MANNEVRMLRITLCSLVVVLVNVVAHAGTRPAPLTNEEKVYLVDDSLRLTGWLMQDTTVKNEPMVILLHQKGLTHESYQPFVDALEEYVGEDLAHRVMPTIIAFDMRGHGKSTLRPRDTVRVETMANAEYLKMPEDIRHVVTLLKKDSSIEADTANVIVIGASIGANTAIMLTEIMPGIRKVVMLSPGKSYHGLEPANAAKKYSGKMLILTAKGDSYSEESSRFIQKLNESHCTVDWFPGEAHGTEIINGDKKAMRQLIDWVMQ
jgi:pimeloyl-ACP methyl ester carboxylesterase